MYTFLQDMIFQKSQKTLIAVCTWNVLLCMCVFLLCFEIYRLFAPAIFRKVGSNAGILYKVKFWALTFAFNCRKSLRKHLQGKEEKETNKENIWILDFVTKNLHIIYCSLKSIHVLKMFIYQWVDFKLWVSIKYDFLITKP